MVKILKTNIHPKTNRPVLSDSKTSCHFFVVNQKHAVENCSLIHKKYVYIYYIKQIKT